MVSLRLVKPLLLLLMGVFLFTRVTSGAIYYYINQRFIMLTVLAAAGFVLFAYSYLRQYLDDASAADPHHHHHDHHYHAPQTWLGLLIVTLPFLLGLAGARAAAGRGGHRQPRD
jgi:putative membrane protein